MGKTITVMLVTLTLLAVGCGGGEFNPGQWPAVVSAPDRLLDATLYAAAEVNAYAGCELLIAVADPAPGDLSIQIAEKGIGAAGCAYVGALLGRSPNVITINREWFERGGMPPDDVWWNEVAVPFVVTHEIGHTLGLEHSSGYMQAGGDADFDTLTFTEEDALWLRSLCL